MESDDGSTGDGEDGMLVVSVDHNETSAPKADGEVEVLSKEGARQPSDDDGDNEVQIVELTNQATLQQAANGLTLDRITVDSQFNVTSGQRRMTAMSFQDILNSLIPADGQGQRQCQVQSQGQSQGQEKDNAPYSQKTRDQSREATEMNRADEQPACSDIPEHLGLPSPIAGEEQKRNVSQQEAPSEASSPSLQLPPRPIKVPENRGPSKRQNIPRTFQGRGNSAHRDRKSQHVKWLKKYNKDRNVVVSIHQRNSSTRIVLAKDAPFVCGWCGSTFTHSLVISDHVTKVHGYVEPSEITQAGKGQEVVIHENSKGAWKKNFSKQGSGSGKKQDIISSIFKKMGRFSMTKSDSEDDSTKLSDDGDSDSNGVVEMFSSGSDAEVALLPKPVKNGTHKNPKKESKSKRGAELPKVKRTRVRSSNNTSTFSSAKKSKHVSKCNICSKVFPSVYQRSMHLEKEHGEYRSAASAEAHRQKLAGDRPSSMEIDLSETVKCGHCETYFISRSAAEKHTRKHCGSHGVKCDVCLKAIQLWNEGKNKEMSNLYTLYEDCEGDKSGNLPVMRDEDATSDGSFEVKKAEASGNDGERNTVADEEGSGKEPGAVAEKGRQTETLAEELLRRSLERTNRVGHSCFLAPCGDCGDQFYLRNHLTQHYRWHGSFTCKECGRVLPKMSDLQVHLEKVHQTGHLKCLYCPRLYTSCGKLNYHMLGHLGFFQCIVCGATFMSKTSLERHVQALALDSSHVPTSDAQRVEYSSSNPFTPPVGRNITRRITRGGDKFQCKYCTKTCVSTHFLRRHIRFHHPEEMEAFVPVEESFMCERCGALLASKATFNQHLKTHMVRSIPCTVPGCKRMFTTKIYLNAHLKTHNTSRLYMKRRRGDNLNICRFCGKQFANITHMRYHEKRNHTRELDQVCDHCGKRFADPSTLKVHLLTHSSMRPYKCDFCDKDFPTELYLRAHLRVHTKPFKCSQCGEGFAQHGARRSHLLRVHGIREPVGRAGRPRSETSSLGQYDCDPSSSSTTTETTGEEYVAAIPHMLGENDYRSVAAVTS